MNILTNVGTELMRHFPWHPRPYDERCPLSHQHGRGIEWTDNTGILIRTLVHATHYDRYLAAK